MADQRYRSAGRLHMKQAAAEGTQRVCRKMAEAAGLAKLHGAGPVNDALARCASYRRFADGGP